MSTDRLGDYLTGHGKGCEVQVALYTVHLRKQHSEEMKKPICRPLMDENSHMEKVAQPEAQGDRIHC